jgi:hypothetical protein
MKHVELVPPFSGSAEFPFVASIPIDPAKLAQFVGMADDRPDIRLLGLDKRDPDRWLIFAACASRQGADTLEREW